MNDQNLAFTIQNQKFYIPEGYFKLTEFTVKSSPRPYQVFWDESAEVCQEINKLLSQNENNLLLIDKKVYELYGNNIAAKPERIFSVEATEEAKTLEGVMAVVDFLQGHNFTKAEKLVVVGGGVIEDIGAFVGAVYKRGITWVLFPTTLLSMCDSCIGGKTGINYKNTKNQLALFSAPRQVFINPGFLQTLPERELKAGLGEMLKLHVTGGAAMVDRYKEQVRDGKVSSPDSYKPLILGSLMVKKAVIEVDEFDQDLRRSLNYGHTFGHAIEAVTDFAIPHGQAVAAGMIIVDQLSNQHKMLKDADAGLLKDLCLSLLHDQEKELIRSLDARKLLEPLKKDKKALGSMINLVILKGIGDTIFLENAVG